MFICGAKDPLYREYIRLVEVTIILHATAAICGRQSFTNSASVSLIHDDIQLVSIKVHFLVSSIKIQFLVSCHLLPLRELGCGVWYAA